MVVVYRPPSYSLNENITLINFLKDFCLGKEVILLGDFDLPGIDWNIPNALFLDYEPLTTLFTDKFGSNDIILWSQKVFVHYI